MVYLYLFHCSSSCSAGDSKREGPGSLLPSSISSSSSSSSRHFWQSASELPSALVVVCSYASSTDVSACASRFLSSPSYSHPSLLEVVVVLSSPSSLVSFPPDAPQKHPKVTLLAESASQPNLGGAEHARQVAHSYLSSRHAGDFALFFVSPWVCASSLTSGVLTAMGRRPPRSARRRRHSRRVAWSDSLRTS